MVGFKYTVGSSTKQIKKANELLLDDKYFSIVKHDKDYEYDSLKYVIKNNIKREIDGNISSGMELDDEVSYFYEQALDKYTEEANDAKTRYTIRYYELNKEESEKYILNFNTRDKAEEYIKKYASEEHNIPYVVKYDHEIIDKNDKDHEAYIYKYDYKVQVVDEDFKFLSDYVDLSVSISELNEKDLNFICDITYEIHNFLDTGVTKATNISELANNINNIATELALTSIMVDFESTVGYIYSSLAEIIKVRIDSGDEINHIESEIIKNFLNNSELVAIKDTTPKKFIDVEAKAEGFNYEQVICKESDSRFDLGSAPGLLFLLALPEEQGS
jgi:hypothetical protein